MIEERFDNLLDCEADALINTVNCVGVMGKGIALQFKKAWPENFKSYASACKSGVVVTGKMHIFETGTLTPPRFIINFPTKAHWKEKSKIEYIEAGLQDLKTVLRARGISSVAVPPLGCGSGGLAWEDVWPRMKRVFEGMPEIHVYLYPPRDRRPSETERALTKEVRMTPGRAALLALMKIYRGGGYELGKIEIQKLAYFLQCAGEPLKLRYEKYIFGPFAENLNHALSDMDGTLIRGFGDRQQQSEIEPLPSALEEADKFLREKPETQRRLGRVENLIDGFDTPYGLELLASVHWIARNESKENISLENIIQKISEWNERKKNIMQPWHIECAMNQLRDQGWLPN
jgi:O-acetyl-ADP-ribose deacetylase (regulator of RNase III)